MGYSLWGHKESDMTEHSTAQGGAHECWDPGAAGPGCELALLPPAGRPPTPQASHWVLSLGSIPRGHSSPAPKTERLLSCPQDPSVSRWHIGHAV